MEEKELVQSVTRALSILEVLAEHSEGMGVTQISEKTKLHKSTVYRLLSTLIYRGYVSHMGETNKYRITLKLFELGNKRIESMNLLSVSKEYTKKLMESINEVVHLVIREDNKIIYIDKVEANNTISMASTIGKRNPMYSTSVGKAILAYLSDKEIKSIWDNSEILKKTKYTISDFSDLKKELKKVKESGYAVDNQENEMGVKCIGAPIFNRNGEVEGAISVSGPVNRVIEKGVNIIAKEVLKYAKLISQELGYMN